MAIMRCEVSSRIPQERRTLSKSKAESLYEAAGLAIAAFRNAYRAMLCGSPRSRFTVEIRQHDDARR
jgi:hypothetical protein